MVLVYGTGAVGAFFGGLLARAGHDVRFVARGAQLDALRSRGLRIDSRILGTLDVPPVRAAARAADLGTADVVLVCVKAHQTRDILDDLAACLTDCSVLIPLQNGVESDELLAGRFGWSRLVPAVVYVGATLDAPGRVTHVAAGRIVIGARPGFDPARLSPIQRALSAEGHVVRISDDIQRERWQKLIWNASFNTVSAVTQRTSDELLASPETRELIVAIMREVIAVGRAHGIALHDSDIDDQIAWTERAPAIRTSMMVDRERGRTMEIDALIGVIVRKGVEAGVPVPHSQTLHALLTSVDTRMPHRVLT